MPVPTSAPDAVNRRMRAPVAWYTNRSPVAGSRAIPATPPDADATKRVTQAALAEGLVLRVEGYPSTQTDAELRAETITVDGKTIPLR